MICNLELQMNSAIILAGGIGSRLNSDIPKQFIRANNGNRIIDFSIEIFRKNKNIDEIIIVYLNIGWRNMAKNIKIIS